MDDKKFFYSLLLSGVVSLVGQVLLLREFVTVFHGSELSLGIVLGCWLVLVAFGSYLSGSLSRRLHDGLRFFVLLQFLSALLLPLEIAVIRSSGFFLGSGAGELVSPPAVLWVSLIVLAPLCMVYGALYSVGCRVFAERSGQGVRVIGRVYVLDALGSLIGGLLFSWFLVAYLNPFQIAFLLGFLTFFASLALSLGSRHPLLVAVSIALILSAAVCFSYSGFFESWTREAEWGKDFVSSADSVYGNIVVVSRQGQYSFYENGLLMSSSNDTEQVEESVDMPMLESGNPKKVLLVGGGLAPVREILKYDVDNVTYVDLDAKAIEVSKRYLPVDDLAVLNDSRVSVVLGDARSYIKDHPGAGYDVVLIDLPDPSTAQLNRFYTLEFFRLAAETLSQKGLVSVSFSSSEDYMGREKRVLGGSIYRTVKSVYPYSVLVPGERSLLMASREDVLSGDPAVLISRLDERGIRTAYVDASFIKYKLSGERVRFALDSLEGEDSSLNTDLQPVGYYYWTLLWASVAGVGVKGIFNVVVVSALAAVLFFGLFLSKSRSIPLMPLAVFVSGLSGMVFEIVALITFQVLHGFLYYMIALITAFYTFGLAAGAWSGSRLPGRFGRKLFSSAYILLAVYCLIMPWMLLSTQNLGIASQAFFMLVVALGGFLSGLVFPLAAGMYGARERVVAKNAGILYSSDLLGACIGAVFSSAYLIPVYGIVPVCLLLACVDISAAFLLYALMR